MIDAWRQERHFPIIGMQKWNLWEKNSRLIEFLSLAPISFPSGFDLEIN